MPLNKDALFVISTVSRESIAEALNSACDEGTDGVGMLTPDDDRLTDALCQEYADALSELDNNRESEEWSFDTYYDQMAGLDERFAARIWPIDAE